MPVPTPKKWGWWPMLNTWKVPGKCYLLNACSDPSLEKSVYTHSPQGHFLKDRHTPSQSLELSCFDNSPPSPNNPIHARKERRHTSWPQSVKYIEGCKGTTWRHFRSAETTCSRHTQALFLETMSVSSQIHLCFEHDVLFFFISTVYYSTVSPRVNKYSGCLQSNYRLIEMFNKVNYFTIRLTFALTARCFSFVFVPCCSGGWGGVNFSNLFFVHMFSHQQTPKHNEK